MKTQMNTLARTLVSLGLLAALAGGAVFGGNTRVGGPLARHEKLRYKNTFERPEQVVEYYVARDASGFVWSGLLDIERRAFTEWRELPNLEFFYIAKQYEVFPAKVGRTEALVEVRYDIEGLGDANGTITPVEDAARDRRVTFKLKKDGNAWKIAEPAASKIAAVVLSAVVGSVGGN